MGGQTDTGFDVRVEELMGGIAGRKTNLKFVDEEASEISVVSEGGVLASQMQSVCSWHDDSEEGLLARALSGEKISHIGQYLVFNRVEADLTVLVVLGQDIGFSHKYIHARAEDGHEYFVCMPLKWTPNHRDILERVRLANVAQVHCLGGGFVMFTGEVLVSGVSGEFGMGNHERAAAVFNALLLPPSR